MGVGGMGPRLKLRVVLPCRGFSKPRVGNAKMSGGMGVEMHGENITGQGYS